MLLPHQRQGAIGWNKTWKGSPRTKVSWGGPPRIFFTTFVCATIGEFLDNYVSPQRKGVIEDIIEGTIHLNYALTNLKACVERNNRPTRIAYRKSDLTCVPPRLSPMSNAALCCVQCMKWYGCCLTIFGKSNERFPWVWVNGSLWEVSNQVIMHLTKWTCNSHLLFTHNQWDVYFLEALLVRVPNIALWHLVALVTLKSECLI